ncbi:hypothetical protein CYMTET_23906 [Cymbomonas tetramitiformis]|uniref:Uncharacterized protein n=1 Tax=Cymbomonas tetramitiformis TaxID=36881 RepID=A0AAE0L0T8_9CHLO|nr:hypothetical protein CYMTET_23906 [Cymbomonas tetramitiformis]
MEVLELCERRVDAAKACDRHVDDGEHDLTTVTIQPNVESEEARSFVNAFNEQLALCKGFKTWLDTLDIKAFAPDTPIDLPVSAGRSTELSVQKHDGPAVVAGTAAATAAETTAAKCPVAQAAAAAAGAAEAGAAEADAAAGGEAAVGAAQAGAAAAVAAAAAAASESASFAAYILLASEAESQAAAAVAAAAVAAAGGETAAGAAQVAATEAGAAQVVVVAQAGAMEAVAAASDEEGPDAAQAGAAAAGEAATDEAATVEAAARAAVAGAAAVGAAAVGAAPVGAAQVDNETAKIPDPKEEPVRIDLTKDDIGTTKRKHPCEQGREEAKKRKANSGNKAASAGAAAAGASEAGASEAGAAEAGAANTGAAAAGTAQGKTDTPDYADSEVEERYQFMGLAYGNLTGKGRREFLACLQFESESVLSFHPLRTMRVAGVRVALDAVGLKTCLYLMPRRRDSLRRATPGDDDVALVEDGRARVVVAAQRNTQTGKQFGIVLRADGVILCEFVNVDVIVKIVVRHDILNSGVKYVHAIVQIKQYAETEVDAELRVMHAGLSVGPGSGEFWGAAGGASPPKAPSPARVSGAEPVSELALSSALRQPARRKRASPEAPAPPAAGAGSGSDSDRSAKGLNPSAAPFSPLPASSRSASSRVVRQEPTSGPAASSLSSLVGSEQGNLISAPGRFEVYRASDWSPPAEGESDDVRRPEQLDVVQSRGRESRIQPNPAWRGERRQSMLALALRQWSTWALDSAQRRARVSLPSRQRATARLAWVAWKARTDQSAHQRELQRLAFQAWNDVTQQVAQLQGLFDKGSRRRVESAFAAWRQHVVQTQGLWRRGRRQAGAVFMAWHQQTMLAKERSTWWVGARRHRMTQMGRRCLREWRRLPRTTPVSSDSSQGTSARRPVRKAGTSSGVSSCSDSDQKSMWQDIRRGLKRLGKDHPLPGLMWFQLEDYGLSEDGAYRLEIHQQSVSESRVLMQQKREDPHNSLGRTQAPKPSSPSRPVPRTRKPSRAPSAPHPGPTSSGNTSSSPESTSSRNSQDLQELKEAWQKESQAREAAAEARLEQLSRQLQESQRAAEERRISDQRAAEERRVSERRAVEERWAADRLAAEARETARQLAVDESVAQQEDAPQPGASSPQ